MEPSMLAITISMAMESTIPAISIRVLVQTVTPMESWMHVILVLQPAPIAIPIAFLMSVKLIPMPMEPSTTVMGISTATASTTSVI